MRTLAFALVAAVAISAGLAKSASAAPDCTALIKSQLSNAGALMRLHVDVGHRRSLAIADFGSGCRLEAELTLEPSGGSDVLLVASGSSGTQYPDPPAASALPAPIRIVT